MSLEQKSLPIGYDYGLKPRLMLLGNTDFPELLRKSFVALLYGRMPDFEGLVEPLYLGLAFEDSHVARRCFGIFKEWADAVGNGDALCLNFIEFKSQEFALCLSPQREMFLDRMLPPSHRDEFDSLILLVGHMKMFPKMSEGYLYFRNKAQKSPFVVLPETRSGPLMDLAFRKSEIHFWKEEEVPENSVEFGLLQSKLGAPNSTPQPQTVKSKMSREDVALRRKRQLSRFYPVTLERLRLQSAWREAARELESEGFRLWQIEQAACNLALRHRVPELFVAAPRKAAESNQEPDTVGITDYLLNNSETVTVKVNIPKILDRQALRLQMTLDSAQLLSYFGNQENSDPKSDKYLIPSAVQQELARLNLLDS